MEINSREAGQKICPFCHAPYSNGANFCSSCGKKLGKDPLSTSIAKQVIVYAVSILLPPLGYGYAWKYLKQPGKKSKDIGSVAIILTTVSLVITIWLSISFINQINQTLNSFNFATF